ncbi:MAG: hypothetical protein DHS20C21_23530 [Gemmatimonadota bacterium]|nr:MAG: hypothetical protein DHS20C21_23530 [Gemmatimonadota bacterium]
MTTKIPTILDAYVLRKHLGPFFFAVFTITFIFVMRVLVELLGLFASRDIGFWTILETLGLTLGWILALTFPMSVLVAVVMAFGRLSQDFEIDAMQAGGVSFLRILAPVLVVGLLLTGGLVVYNNSVLPETNHRLKTLTADIHKTKPTIVIREGVFLDDFDGYTLLVREVDHETGLLYDITIYVLDPREPVRTIHAPWGELKYDDGGNQLVIELHDGEMHEVNPDDPGSYQLLNFERHNLIFGDLGTKLERREGELSRGDRELSAPAMMERTRILVQEKAAEADSVRLTAAEGFAELRAQIQATLAPDATKAARPAELVSQARILLRKLVNGERRVDRKDRDIQRYQVEIHKKYSFPVACLVFVMVGAPIGARMRRGGLGAGSILSFGFFLVYYLASLGGEKLGDRGVIPPALGMWAIDLILGLVGVALILRADARWPFRKARPS